VTLIVEDGTGKVDSNTYIDEAGFRSWADSLGEGDDLPATDPELEALLLRAMYVLEAECWLGSRTYPENPQALSFPRTGLSYDGVDVPSDSIPQQLIDAQCSYALTANTQDLYNSVAAGAAGAVIEERVEGAVTVKYSDTGGSAVAEQTQDGRANALIEPFTCASSGLFGVRA
jgi:hypothetical protein